LRSGEKRDHNPDDYITKITGVAPDDSMPTPLWDAFLKHITNGDAELELYLQRKTGYELTGVTREHALFFSYGTGANGKSTSKHSPLPIKIGIQPSSPACAAHA
jgi:putative DNA primase/helicase